MTSSGHDVDVGKGDEDGAESEVRARLPSGAATTAVPAGVAGSAAVVEAVLRRLAAEAEAQGPGPQLRCQDLVGCECAQPCDWEAAFGTPRAFDALGNLSLASVYVKDAADPEAQRVLRAVFLSRSTIAAPLAVVAVAGASAASIARPTPEPSAGLSSLARGGRATGRPRRVAAAAGTPATPSADSVRCRCPVIGCGALAPVDQPSGWSFRFPGGSGRGAAALDVAGLCILHRMRLQRSRRVRPVLARCADLWTAADLAEDSSRACAFAAASANTAGSPPGSAVPGEGGAEGRDAGTGREGVCNDPRGSVATPALGEVLTLQACGSGSGGVQLRYRREHADALD